MRIFCGKLPVLLQTNLFLHPQNQKTKYKSKRALSIIAGKNIIMDKIKFGTDGWRAIIAEEFTVENVKRVAYATALWLRKHYQEPSAVVGNDCRFAGKLFADTTACVLASQGIKVYRSENTFVSTPMVSLGTVKLQADAGIVITASHNPAEYNGYKIKASYGGPATPAMIDEVEALIPDTKMKVPRCTLLQ